MSEPEAIPAATVVILRDREGGPPELLMVERAATMAFAAGALVFPGGRVDPGDRLFARLVAPELDEEDAAARVAAVRETIEEVGLAPGLAGEADVQGVRRLLQEGASIGDALAQVQVRIDLAALEPFARWRPNFPEARVFDTRFYLARAGPGWEPVADQGETVRAFWASAGDVLEAAGQGRARIIFPTRRNLERIATFESYEDALASARRYPVRLITPWLEARGGREYLCIPDDLGYPVTAEPRLTAVRG